MYLPIKISESYHKFELLPLIILVIYAQFVNDGFGDEVKRN